MTEADLQEQVRLMCGQLGLYHYHTHDSRRSQSGFPDSFIMNRVTGRIIYRELKSESGDLSAAQKAVRYALVAGGHDYAVWRPRHLADRTIQSQLADLAGVRRKEYAR